MGVCLYMDLFTRNVVRDAPLDIQGAGLGSFKKEKNSPSKPERRKKNHPQRCREKQNSPPNLLRRKKNHLQTKLPNPAPWISNGASLTWTSIWFRVYSIMDGDHVTVL